MELSDEALIEAHQQGDEAAFGRLVRRYGDSLLGYLVKMTGNIKIYRQVNEQRNLSYAGGSNIKYIPVNEGVELNLGPARQVKVEPKLMEFHTENYTFDNKNNISGWDEVRTWRIEISNTRTLPAEIEITRGFESAYRSLKVNEESGNQYEE